MKIGKVLFLYVVLAALVQGCGVKDRGGNVPPPPVQEGQLPAGVHVTDSGKLLVHTSQDTFKVNASGENTDVTYKIVDTALESLSGDYTYDVSYAMPEMPTMPVTPAVISQVSPGNLKVTYHLSMAGTWQFVIHISKAGTVVDTFTFSTEVAD